MKLFHKIFLCFAVIFGITFQTAGYFLIEALSLKQAGYRYIPPGCFKKLFMLQKIYMIGDE